ncbi:hypothetical protein TB2_043376 [Malus domestica]
MHPQVERVQDIASISKDEIPEEFIRSENEQQGITTVQGKTLECPTIDFSIHDDVKILNQIIEASRDEYIHKPNVVQRPN